MLRNLLCSLALVCCIGSPLAADTVKLKNLSGNFRILSVEVHVDVDVEVGRDARDDKHDDKSSGKPAQRAQQRAATKQPQPPAASKSPSSARRRRSRGQEFPQVISTDTPYYKSGPQQARPADGTLKAGTPVIVVEQAGSYVRVRSKDGIVGYVASDHLKPASAKKARGKRRRGDGGGGRGARRTRKARQAALLPLPLGPLGEGRT